MNYNLNQYQSNQIQTAPKEQLMIMLYDGAIRFINQAHCSIESGDQPGKLEAIGKAINIANYLSSTLNHDVGAQITADLEDLYTFVTNELCLANLNDECQHLENAKNVLFELREGWMGAIALSKEENSVAAGSQPASAPA